MNNHNHISDSSQSKSPNPAERANQLAKFTVQELQEELEAREEALDEQECEERDERKNKAVLEELRRSWPAAADWNDADNDTVQILDSDSNVIATISCDDFPDIWNPPNYTD
jgi:flagellar hook-length control protein FliK